MKQRFKVTLLASFASMILFASCEKTLDKMATLNLNENAPTSVIPSALLTQAESSGVFTDQGGFGDGPLGIFNGHMAGNHATGLNYNQYQLTNNDFQGLFLDAYLSSMMNLKQIIVNAKSSETAYVGVAQILQAYQLGYVTSLYGNIPWSQALDVVKYPHPKYDAQADVYTAMQGLLTSGIKNIATGGTVKGDIFYSGDLGKWKALAYMLSARYYNHMSKKDPAGSATNALAAIAAAKAAGFTSADNDFQIPYDGSSSFINPWNATWENGMYVANMPFLKLILTTNDPRIRAYYTSTAWTSGTTSYGLGKTQDGDVGTGNYMTPGDSTFFGAKDAPQLFATYFELKFIEAEANMRAGNAAAAAAALNAAVAAQLKKVMNFDEDAAMVPAYVATYASETATTITMEKIMTEKYKAMICQEAETWMDVRRHNYAYPAGMQAIPVISNATPTKVAVASSFIQRLLYPQSELNNNASNVPKAGIFDKLPILQ